MHRTYTVHVHWQQESLGVLSKRDEGLLNTWAEKLAVTDIDKAVTSRVRAT